MLIGSTSQFAIEYEIMEIIEGSIYGPFRLWANGEPIGDWDDVAMISGCVYWLCRFAAEPVNRFEPDLKGRSKEELYQILYDSFMYDSFTEATKSDEPYNNTYVRFNITHLGMSSFDHYVVLLVEEGNQQHLVWHTNTDNIIREAFLPNGEMQRVARQFCDAMHSDPITAPLLHK